jgi:outer membrane protein assembly factor BamB
MGMRLRLASCWLCAALVALTLSVRTARADDWPRFRGPNGTGIVDAVLPVRWTPDNILWKTALPGVGHSSAVIGGGKVFLQSASADGRSRYLLCLDAAGGKLLWQKEVPGASARMHKKNSLASSTPALDSERVYAAFWDGEKISLVAHDYRGKLIWQKDLGGFKSQHGAGFSPIVVDGRVVLVNDQDGSAAVVAFDWRTGAPLWRADRKAYRACYSTPFVRETASGKELIVVSTAAISGYDLDTGSEKWYCTWPNARMPLRTVSSPILAAGLVIATAGDGAGDRLCIAVKPGGRGDVTDAARIWEDRKAFPYVPSLLAQDDFIYSVNDAGVASCHRAASGEVIWQERLGGAVTASPLLAAGKVYAATEAGEVFVFEAATSYKLLARNKIGEPVFATPAVADGRMFIRGREHLFCIGEPAPKRAAR